MSDAMRQFGIASSQLFSGRDPGSPLTCYEAFARPGMPTEFVAAFRDFYGPTMNAFEAAAKNGKADDLQRELEELFTAQNKSGRQDLTSIPATYLRVMVKR